MVAKNGKPQLVMAPQQMARRIVELTAQVRGLQQMAVGNQMPLSHRAKDQNYWDRNYIRALGGEQIRRFFVARTFEAGTPQAGQVKTTSEFNLKVEGTFPKPREYTCYGLRVAFLTDVTTGESPLVTDIEAIRAFSVIRYYQGLKGIWEYKLDRFSAPGFVGGASANAAGGFVNFGPPGITDWYMFREPLPIKADLSFSWEIQTAPELLIENDVLVQVEMIGQEVGNVR